MKRKINKIILHVSDSNFGDASLINDWHLERGWKGIGYHRVILNGNRHTSGKADSYDARDDGLIELGRDDEEAGAHCYGHNTDSIGVCLIARRTFTFKQFKTCIDLSIDLLHRFCLGRAAIFGHYEMQKNKQKTCPNFDMDEFRKMLAILGKDSGGFI